MRLTAVLLLVVFVVCSLPLCWAEEDDEGRRMELELDAGQLFDRSYIRVVNEHYPATMTVEMYKEDGERRDCASIVFSLADNPRFFEPLRLGIAVDMQYDANSGWTGQKEEKDDRVYFYARSEQGFCSLHFFFPLAQNHNGYDWHWRVAAEDLSLDLRSGFSLVADLDYSPEYGFRHSCGIGYERAGWRVVAGTDRLSAGWSSTAEF